MKAYVREPEEPTCREVWGPCLFLFSYYYHYHYFFLLLFQVVKTKIEIVPGGPIVDSVLVDMKPT